MGIDRLIDAFARAFSRDNPDVASSDQLVILVYGALMLNTELHNPRARGAWDGAGWTKDDFWRMAQSDDGQLTLREMCDELYDSIKENALIQFSQDTQNA